MFPLKPSIILKANKEDVTPANKELVRITIWYWNEKQTLLPPLQKWPKWIQLCILKLKKNKKDLEFIAKLLLGHCLSKKQVRHLMVDYRMKHRQKIIYNVIDEVYKLKEYNFYNLFKRSRMITLQNG